MKICKIWDADYPWDIRVEKVADSLADAGHEVHLVCRNAGRLPRTDWTGKFHIHRLPLLPRNLGPLHLICNFPHPANPFWWAEIAKVVHRYRVDLILVRDLPLAIPAGVLGRLFRVPVVLDMAENYPAMLRDRLRYTPTSMLGRIVRHPNVAKLIEWASLRLVNHVVVVVEESSDRLITAGVPKDQLTVVTNTPRIDHWDASQTVRSKRVLDGGLHVVYLGNLDGSRGVDVAIKAVAHLKRQGTRARLTIIGQGPSRTALEELVRGLDVADRVTIRGRLPFRDVQAVMAESDVGIIPHYSTEAWNTTMPNKLFDYMLWGIPVLVSDVKPVAKIVHEVGCGCVFRDRDYMDLARSLETMGDPSVRAQMGRNGREAIAGRYNWKVEGKEFVDCIERVCSDYRKQ